MSCLDVMYHQSYGAHHYLPATSAAAAYKAAYYHHQQQQHQQKRKFCIFALLQHHLYKCCIMWSLFVNSINIFNPYFRGDIGDVVDEHFSRALSQPSAFSSDAKTGRLHSGGPWKGNSHSEGQPLPSSLWGSGYPSQTSSHPAFHPADTGLWSSHSLTQTGLPPPSALPDSWHYGLGAQGGAGYPHVHEMYPHMHPRHPHPHSHAHHVLHHAHNPALDPRFSPLLLPGVRASCSPTSCADGIKTELEPSSIPAPSWPASFHGSVDIYHDTGETR
uniref:Vestigial-like family member 3 n=1 Tax=Sinocyclocheilus rhinocerous TaxID=307959 RepID=A0A673FXC0_9TELE